MLSKDQSASIRLNNQKLERLLNKNPVDCSVPYAIQGKKRVSKI